MPRNLRILVLAVGLLVLLATLWPRLADSRIPGNHQGYAPEQPIAYSHRLHAGELGIDCQYCHVAASVSRHAGIPSANVCMNCHRSVTSASGARAAALEDLQSAAEGAKADYERALASGTDPGEMVRFERAMNDARKAADSFNPQALLSPELAKLYGHVGFDPKAGQYVDGAARRPIRWRLIHRLPDFVYFDHRSHVGAGVTCQTCHGPVETMERVRQFNNLSMGWCVNCHRAAQADGIQGRPANPSIDCSACHY